MKKYESPEIMIEELFVEDVITTTFTESDSDNESGWLDKWTSGILNG